MKTRGAAGVAAPRVLLFIYGDSDPFTFPLPVRCNWTRKDLLSGRREHYLLGRNEGARLPPSPRVAMKMPIELLPAYGGSYSPAEYVRLIRSDPHNVRSVRIQPPRLGQPGFGSLLVE